MYDDVSDQSGHFKVVTPVATCLSGPSPKVTRIGFLENATRQVKGQRKY